MKKTLDEKISQLLDKMMSVRADEVEPFMREQWAPFIQSLTSEEDRVLAIKKFWQCQTDNLNAIANHIKTLPDADFQQIVPQLQSLVDLGETIRAESQKQPAATA
jgi:hypothetical protein